MKISEIVSIGRSADRLAQHTGQRFRFSDERLLAAGASLQSIAAAKTFLRRYDELDAEVLRADGQSAIDK